MSPQTLTDLNQLLKLQRGMHGEQSPQVCDVLVRIAKLHISKSDWEHAEPELLKALDIARELDDQTRMMEIDALIGNNSKAADEALSDEQSWKVSSARVPIFSSAQKLAASPVGEPATQLDDAIERAKVELLRLKQTLGHQNAAVADAFVRLADLFCRKGMLNEMEPLLFEALKIREFVCGERHVLVSTDLKNIARLYYLMNRFALAEYFLDRALNIRETALGADHPQVADLCELKAVLLRRTMRMEEAEVLEARVVETRSRHGNRWEKLKEVGVKAIESKNWREAKQIWFAAMEAAKNFRDDDPRLINTLESLSEVYWNLEKYDEAEPICSRLLRIAQTCLGANHMDVANAASNLAMVCEAQEKYAEASMLIGQALAIKENILGTDNPDVIATQEMLQQVRKMAQKQVESKLERLS